MRRRASRGPRHSLRLRGDGHSTVNHAALALIVAGALLLGGTQVLHPSGQEPNSSLWAQATRGGENFWASDSNCDAPSSWNQQFSGSAGGGVSPYTYTWYFGNQSPVSHSQDPDPRFTSLTSFNVSLEVNDSSGNHAWSNLSVEFWPSPGCGLPTIPIYDTAGFALGVFLLAVLVMIAIGVALRRRAKRRGRRASQPEAIEPAPTQTLERPSGAEALDNIEHDR